MPRPMVIAAACVVVIATVLAVVWTLQRRLMYFPTADVSALEAAEVAGLERVTFDTSDGLRLNGWFFAASGPSSRTTIVVFSGNAGNRFVPRALAAALHRHGLQVLLVDYRGYGGNPGSPSQEGLAADARAARAYVAGRPDVDPSRLVYFGESLGTAVAVDLAAEYPPVALVLRSPFTSMSDLGRHHYPFLPVRLLLRDRFAAIDQIRQIHVPLLVVAGGRDQIVPIESSRRLYDAATTAKTFLLLPNADHNDYELLAGEEMIDAIVHFLEALR